MMNPNFNIKQLLSPGFSKIVEENARNEAPPVLPVDIFSVDVENYLSNNCDNTIIYSNFDSSVERPAPAVVRLGPVDENKINTRNNRQILGIKSSGTSSNINLSAADSRRRPMNNNAPGTTKFGFSKH